MTRLFAHCIILCFTAAAFIPNTIGQETCPFGWTADSRRSRCIKVMDSLMTSDNASISCKSVGGGLVRIEDIKDQEIVNNLITQHKADGKQTAKNYFIDMNHDEITDEWKFENGDNVTWFYWDNNQPNGFPPDYPNGQHCMAIYRVTLKWHDQDCDVKLGHYICMLYPGCKGEGRSGMSEGSFVEEPTGCLVGQRLTLSYSSIGPYRLQKFRCAAECNRDQCCSAFVVGNDECLLYVSDTSIVDTKHCTGPLYKTYIKKIVN